ncbi:MAG: c-type cytochrome [Chitinophagaceae bacterium]|nr:c-type cytochrome [Chitinophagaceae bacterium]
MKQPIFTVLTAVALTMLMACGGQEPASSEGQTKNAPKSMVADASSYDPKRGEGKYNAGNTAFGALDAGLAGKGEAIAGTKCFSCHKTTDERLVGPGWKGVTARRQPYWILNFITNPDPMIDKDPEVQAQLELCLVRMPNQNLSDDEARQIFEFMRKNDGTK